MPTHKISAGIILLVIIAGIVCVVTIITYLDVRYNEIEIQIQQKQSINMFFILEQDDQLVVAQAFLYHPTTKKGAIVDVPTNLGDLLPQYGSIDRISRLYNDQYFDQYRAIVENILNIQIPFWMIIDLDNIEPIVDIMGGVEIFIEEELFESTSSDQYLPLGMALLDGYKMKQYVSHLLSLAATLDREDQTTYWQRLIVRLLATIQSQSPQINTSDGLELFQQNIETNLDQEALSAMIAELSRFEWNDIVIHQPVGEIRYVTVEGVEHALFFLHFDGKWLQETVARVQKLLSGEQLSVDQNTTVRLAILNGTDTGGLARRTSALYSRYNVDVVAIGNAEQNDIEKTLVIDHTGNGVYAIRIAEIIKAVNIVSENIVGNNSGQHVTLVLGADFNGDYVR